MKKKTLKEQLERIHVLTYGRKMISEDSNFLNDIFNKLGINDQPKVDDPKKADFVTDNVNDLFNTIQNTSKTGGLRQQSYGTMSYQKEVEALQIGLTLLGYKLPNHGIDGLFGPETGAAVTKFKSDNSILNESASDLRTTLSSLGYKEKNSEISSGGEVSDQLTSIVDKILQQFKALQPNVVVTVTGGNDRFHKTVGYTSKHTTGQAIDLTLQPLNQETKSAFVSVLDHYKSSDAKFSYINEYDNPSDAATAGHFHLQYGAGGVSGGSQHDGEKATASPEMLNKLYELLKQRGVNAIELKDLIDSSPSSGNNLQGVSAEDFSRMIDVIINNLEGGYYHPDMNIRAMGDSGETMFGIDRTHGPESQTTAGREFWKIIDDADARHKWSNEYMGGEYAPKLKQLVVEMMKPQYISFFKYYLTPESQQIVSKSPKLVFNFLYATYNGSGWFHKFANVINQKVKEGISDPNQLSELLQSERKGSKNQIIAQTGRKIDSILSGQA
jgi:peptidoglycan hydrolase-like protein with peptidoglycan-binding domain